MHRIAVVVLAFAALLATLSTPANAADIGLKAGTGSFGIVTTLKAKIFNAV